MSGRDQVLMLGSAIGVVLMIAALWNSRQLQKHERELAAQEAKVHPAE
jgi:hypothetical protein